MVPAQRQAHSSPSSLHPDPAALAKYFPRWVRRACWDWGEDSKPRSRASHGAILFLDLVGFSRHTTNLASLGPRGAEDLSIVLNRAFGRIVDEVETRRGDVIAFVGDGILALWDTGDAIEDARRAVACAIELQQGVNPTSGDAASSFRVRISVEYGAISYCRIGGTAGLWQHLVVGDPLVAVGAAYRRGAPGEVVVGPAARALLGPKLQSAPIDAAPGLAVAVALSGPPPVADLVEDSAPLPPGALRHSLSPTILEHAGTFETTWLAEIRNLSIVKVRLKERDSNTPLADLHAWLSQVEKASMRLDGAVTQVQLDDKGVSAAVLFGLPPFAHEDDAFRAVEAALLISDDLSAQGLRASVGLTTGLAFCGELGGRGRREFTALGVAMNLASRLMETGEEGILCDAATAAAVERRVSFSATMRLKLKGWPDPVVAFRPEVISRQVAQSMVRRTIGRERERSLLRDAVERLRQGAGGVVRIEGEAGIGKSTLLHDLMESARAHKLCALHSSAAAIDRATPYYVWRDILGQLFAPHYSEAPAKLLNELADEPRLASWLPLLEDILPLGLTENPLTRAMVGLSRAAAIEDLVVFFLGAAAARQKTLLLFDDAHWIDGASLALLRAVAHRLPQILMVIARRPGEEAADARSVFAIEPDVDIALGGLPNERVIEIACQRLGVSSVPSALAEAIVSRAVGNPFYCEELTFAMRDMGVLRVEHGECRAADEIGASVVLPTSIKNVVVARFDALPPEHRLVLKVASALGGGFSPEFFKAVCPHELSVEAAKSLLNELVAKTMLRSTLSEGEGEYEFRHALFESAIYETLSFAQRRDLHARAAEVIETTRQDALESLHAQLARHWELADRSDLAVAYLEKAAAQALRSYANLDAVRYLGRALKLSEATRVDPRTLGAWQSMLGDAHHELMDYDQASLNYRNAMTALGHRPPSTRAELAREVLVHALWQAKRRLVPSRRTAAPGADIQRVAHMYERLSEEYFYANNRLPLLHGTLASLNLAETCGAVAETIAGYNALALGLSMAGGAAVGRIYLRRALRLAEQEGGLPDLARAHLVAGVVNCGLGDWGAVRMNAELSEKLFRQLGDRVRLANAVSMAVYEAILRCDLAAAETRLRTLSEIIAADPNATADVRAWHLCAQVSVDALRGSVAPSLLDELRELSDTRQAPANLLLCHGILSVGCLRAGDMAAAARAAEAGARTLHGSQIVWAAFGALGAGGIVQTLVALWEDAAEKGSGDAERLRGSAEFAAARFARLSRRSPVCWPWALLWRGQARFLVGGRDAARRDWLRARSAAERLGMPYAAGLASFELGRRVPIDEADQRGHLGRAERIFMAHGADQDLARLRRVAMQL
jgi:hypothetical protein